MLIFSSIRVLFAALLAIAIAAPTGAKKDASFLVHQFPNGTWVENLALRTSSTPIPQILATVITAPNVYLLTPSLSPNKAIGTSDATILVSFNSSATSVLGITELDHASDRFAVVTGSPDLAVGDTGAGSYAVHLLDLAAYPMKLACTSLVANFTDGGLLNGIATLSASRRLVVVADSTKGKIWLLNTKTGAKSILLAGEALEPPANSTGIVLGINGIKVKDGAVAQQKEVYFSNTGRKLLNRIAIDLDTLKPVGGVTTLLNNISIDDFALRGGKAYLATSAVEATVYDLKTGETSVLIGGANETVLAGVTSAAVGEGVVYFGTHGGATEDGRVVGVFL